jgi:hypothetical protein
MMRILILGLIFSLNVTQSNAKVVYGPGSKPCSTLVKAWEGGSFFDKNIFDAWMTGFVSGANWISKKSIQADETDFGMSLLKFCKANPSKKVITGVIYVYTELN